MSTHCLLVCPVCSDEIVPPIFECSEGHLLCGKCQNVISNCRLPLNDRRNLKLERMCQSFRYPCQNILLGCKAYCQTPGPLGRQAHKLLCNFRSRNCVIDLTQRCLWTRVFGPEYLTHMKEEHPNSIHESNKCHIEVNVFLYFISLFFYISSLIFQLI